MSTTNNAEIILTQSCSGELKFKGPEIEGKIRIGPDPKPTLTPTPTPTPDPNRLQLRSWH